MNAEMTDQECKELVTKVFELIRNAVRKRDVSAKDILEIPNQLQGYKQGKYVEKIETNKPDERYPRLFFRLGANDIEDLKKQGVLSQDLEFNMGLAAGKIGAERPLSSLEKVLYAVLWKNGDLGKEKHVIEGISGERRSEGSGIVFNKFGAYLSGGVPYILDQHTLRSYAVSVVEEKHLSKVRKIETLSTKNKQHKPLIEGYENFYGSIEKSLEGILVSREREDFFYELDRLLFGLGKLIKMKKNNLISSPVKALPDN